MTEKSDYFEIVEKCEIDIDTAFEYRDEFENKYGEFSTEELESLIFTVALVGLLVGEKLSDETIIRSTLLCAWLDEQIELRKELGL